VLNSIVIIAYNYEEWTELDDRYYLYGAYGFMLFIIIFGTQSEGMRFAQLLYLFGYLLSAIWLILEIIYEEDYTFQLVINIIYGVLLLYYIWFGLKNGWGSLAKYQSSGPYQVGSKLIRSGTLGNEILVFYPMN